MNESDISNIFYYKRLNNKNLENQLKKFAILLNNDFKEIIESSFKAGFDEGEKMASDNESLTIRGKIIGKLFSTTNLTDEDIYEIVGFGEDKWREYIKYFRGKYEEGKSELSLDGNKD